VAIIGAGPAGLTVADGLLRKGHEATIFEALPVVGGMMAVGIPAYRLPRDVIRHEVERIEQLGAQIRLSTPIGPDGKYTIDDLFEQGFDAVFVGIGAHKSRGLRIPGEQMRGVVSGIELLKAISLSQQTHDPQWQMKILSYLLGGSSTRVAIIGGGNTAIDVARSLKRLGVDEVQILYRRTRAEMPALPEELDEADHEGIPIELLVSPVRILGDDKDRVSALKCVRMKLGEPDPSGRRRPVPIPGSEFLLDVDMVVEAIGQSPDLALLGQDHSYALTRQGTFDVDHVSSMTSRPGVFAAGDAITQPVSVIDAIGSAKRATAGIDAYLRGVTMQASAAVAGEEPLSQRELLPEELTLKPRHSSPTVSVAQRLGSYDEVELGYDAETAVAEASRCLACGPCAECLACVAVCEPQAILHDQREHVAHLEVGAIVRADGSGWAQGPGQNLGSGRPATGNGRQGIYQVEPFDPLAGSAAAASVMMELFTERRSAATSVPVRHTQGAARVGVFICECNGQISEIVDTAAVESAARTWSGVTHTQILSQSCSPEAADTIYQAVADQNLNRVVLAACSCCAVDQVCYSCTYQRVRCKDNLLGRHFDRGNALFEFVNIREQCAWAHSANPEVATATASAMVAAAVAKTRLSVSRPRVSLPFEKTALIIGSGQAATICQGALSVQRIQALRLRRLPKTIQQTPNHFTAILGNSALWNASALVLAPRDQDELGQIMAAFGAAGRQPRTQGEWGQTDTHRPGIFVCDPAVDAIVAGMAAAARTAAWLGHKHPWPATIASEVDPSRCRGCGDCEQVCEFGAIQLQGEGDARVAWIDPLICQADGTCATRCPAGAIRTGHPTAEQIEAMLEAILS
jgi:NADPH-dependent glutamate synthase beta subunit-like oxidoreductase/NAD-dependent dihydropyrimidine dehydrogenase PreA subunit